MSIRAVASPLACLVLLAASLNAAAGDLYSEINRQRTGPGGCGAVAKLAPLAPRAELERVARDLAQGDSLEGSLRSVGYRSARASAVSLNGDGTGARREATLARQISCRYLQDAAMTEVGVFQDSRQVWIVMAAPLSAQAGMQAQVPGHAAGVSTHRSAPVSAQGLSQAAGQRILELVNRARATSRYCGDKVFDAVRPLRWNDLLAEASRLHAEDMARHNYFSHKGRDGSDPTKRIELAGYRWRATGENIAAGQRNAEEAVAGWVRSPGHCANLMEPDFTEMGAAVAVDRRSEMGVYWAQEFGAPRLH